MAHQEVAQLRMEDGLVVSVPKAPCFGTWNGSEFILALVMRLKDVKNCLLVVHNIFVTFRVRKKYISK